MAVRLTVGLTGGVASGKSLVGDAFAALGVPVLDADQVSREVVQPGSPALAAIAQTFGAGFLRTDGTLDRARMREHVFAHPEARRQLESLLHPQMQATMLAWRAAQTHSYCIFSVAILVESGFRALVDRILVVDAPEAVQRERLVARDHISPALAAQMLAAQASREQRLQAAHDVLCNAGDPAMTREHVRTLHHYYLRLAAGETPESAGVHVK
jgi:dephospho-CoA kinase